MWLFNCSSTQERSALVYRVRFSALATIRPGISGYYLSPALLITCKWRLQGSPVHIGYGWCGGTRKVNKEPRRGGRRSSFCGAPLVNLSAFGCRRALLLLLLSLVAEVESAVVSLFLVLYCRQAQLQQHHAEDCCSCCCSRSQNLPQVIQTVPRCCHILRFFELMLNVCSAHCYCCTLLLDG